MAHELNIQRKNIDLPIETLQKLSLMAVAQGRSLKAYIEEILISKADSIVVEVRENPSPSGDEWFNDAQNLQMVNEGIKQKRAGKVKAYSMKDIKSILGV